jgi:predicted CoA-binding protein
MHGIIYFCGGSMSQPDKNEIITKILQNAKTIAVVGISSKRDRPSYTVAKYMEHQGYKIIPVNPIFDKIDEKICYPSLTAIPGDTHIDVVNIFRHSDEVPPVVEESIKLKVDAIWMQFNIVNEEAAQLARSHGIDVIMDKCIKSEHMKRRELLKKK